MKSILLTALLGLFSLAANAQESQPFKGYFTNEEFSVYMHINLYGDGMHVPDHDMFGNLPGYLARQHNGFYWLITDAEVKNGKEARLQMINDYGSEDLEATLKIPNDSTLILIQGEGSPIKVPKNGKWQKLPSKMTFKRQQ